MPDFTDYETHPMICPGCGEPMDGHQATGGQAARPPQLDDRGICLECGQLAVYDLVDGILAMRVPTDAETDEMLANPHVQYVIQAVKAAREGVIVWDQAPCGCSLGTGRESGENVMYFRPCNLKCPTYQYFLKKSAAAGSPIEVRDKP